VNLNLCPIFLGKKKKKLIKGEMKVIIPTRAIKLIKLTIRIEVMSSRLHNNSDKQDALT
jgi:hypothetical protein